MPAAMWPTVAGSLHTLWSQLGLTLADSTPVGVWEGRPYGWDDMLAGVAIGVDGAYVDGNSGEFEQTWRDAGPAPDAHREETGEVVCTLWVSSGEDDMATVRDAAFGILDALWAAVDDIGSLDPTGNRVVSVWIARADPMLIRQAGCLAEIPFRLRYRAVF